MLTKKKRPNFNTIKIGTIQPIQQNSKNYLQIHIKKEIKVASDFYFKWRAQ